MRPSPFTKTIALSILLGCLAVAAYSQGIQTRQEQLKQLSIEQLGNLEIITQSKAPQQIWKTSSAIYVITQEDIRRSGANSIPEALRIAPGVEVARVSGDKWSIGIRGFGSRLARSVLVLIDGRSVYTTLLAGTYWEVQDTLMEDIDRIEVIRGPGGTVWGPNAVDGVINIITKNSKDTQGELVSAGGGNEKQASVGVRYGSSNAKGLSYRLYGKGFLDGPEYHFDRSNYDRWGAVQAGFRTDWVRNERDSFTVQGDLYDQRAGETVQRTSYTAPFSEVIAGNALLSGGNVLGRWTRVFREGDDIQVQAYFDSANRHEPNFADIRNTVDVDFLQRFHWGSRNHVSWGLGARASHGHEPPVTSGLYFIPDTRTDQLYTAFFQDSVTLLPNRLTLEVGTKLLRTNYTQIEPEPSGRLLWTSSDTQTVWLSVTRAVRTPSAAERAFFLSGFVGTAPGGVPFFARFNANPDFKSEKLDGYELGFRRLVGHDLYLSMSAFFNQYHDLFSEDFTGPVFLENTPTPAHLLLPAQFANGLMGSTSGAEVVPEWRPTSFWRLRGSYSFLHMVIKKGPNSQDVGTEPIVAGTSPQHQVLVQSSFDLPRDVTLDFDYRYVSALQGISVPAYSTGSARIAWTLNRRLELSLVGENLLQPYHVEFASDPGPNVAIKRSVYAKLVWRSKEN